MVMLSEPSLCIAFLGRAAEVSGRSHSVCLTVGRVFARVGGTHHGNFTIRNTKGG